MEKGQLVLYFLSAHSASAFVLFVFISVQEAYDVEAPADFFLWLTENGGHKLMAKLPFATDITKLHYHLSDVTKFFLREADQSDINELLDVVIEWESTGVRSEITE